MVSRETDGQASWNPNGLASWGKARGGGAIACLASNRPRSFVAPPAL